VVDAVPNAVPFAACAPPTPPHEVKLAIIRRLRELAGKSANANASEQGRNRLEGQLERLKDLYLLGDLTKDEYVPI
jgi:hypothetical protein